MRACTNCGGTGHSRSNCPMPKPDALTRETTLGTEIEASLRPSAADHAALADLLVLQNPEWPRTRCMLRASIEWQKGTGAALLAAAQLRLRA